MIKILVVEADLLFFTQLQEILAEADGKTFGVVHAISLEQGLAHLGGGKLDLALVDLFLPDSQGLPTYTRFSAAAPGLAIAILGSIEDKASLIQAVHKGAQGYLVKESLNAERLLQTIQHSLEQSKDWQARQDAGEQNRLLLAHIPLPLVALDRKLVIQYCNDVYARLLGKPLKELTGRNIHELFPRFAKTRASRAYHECLETGQVQEVNSRFGKEYYHMQVYPTPSGLLAIGQNITRDKQLEVALRQSEERYHSIFDGARDAILVETPDGRILDVNPSACEMFGYSRKEFLKLPVADITEPETVIGLKTDLAELEKSLPLTPVEAINIRRGGEHFPVEVSARLQTIEDETVMIVVVRDITERKRSMDELHYHASLEMLITALTTRFISVPSEAVESEIHHSLQTLGEFIGADRAHLYLLSDNGTRMFKGYEWYAEGCSAGIDHMQGLPVEAFPWFFNILRRFDFINIGRVKDLPAEASAEKEHWLAQSVHSTLAFPLVLNNALIGFWGFNAEHGEKFWSETDVNLLKLIGDVLAAALAKKWAEEALRASEAQYRLLAEGISDIVMLHDLEGRLVYISPSVQRVLGWTEAEAARDFMRDYIHPDDRGMILSLFEYQLKKGQDVNLQWRFRHKAGAYVWMDTHVHVISENGRPYRWLSSSRDISARKLAEEELQKANEKLILTVTELQKRNREANLLSEMSDMLQSCLKPEEIYEVVAQYSLSLFTGCSGALYILNASQGFVEAVTGWGDHPPQELVFETDACWALRRGRTQIYRAGSSDLACKHIDQQSEVYVCIPMSAQGEAIGMLHLTGAEDSIHERFEQLAVMVAERVALALTNLKLRLTLHLQSIRDPLTGLFNRRFMDESLEREVHRASRNHQPISIIMIDIDHFKAFNDAYGHEVGDALLQVIGSYLTGNTRGGDLACRFSGEKFLLILPEATLENTVRRAEEFRTGIKGLVVQQKDRLLGGITISIGAAAYPEHGQTVDALLRAVEVALYRAKEAGRDCVVVAQPG